MIENKGERYKGKRRNKRGKGRVWREMTGGRYEKGDENR